MLSFKIKRKIWRIVGISCCVIALIALFNDWKPALFVSLFVLLADLVIIAVRNRCPFCRRPLRIAPTSGEEYCPHCGSKIE